MKHYQYLVIGGGMTADAAVRGIRELDPSGSIGVIGQEADLPYERPPLSKEMWQGQPLEKIWLGTDKLAVELRLGRAATSLDPAGKRVRDDRGDEYSYDRLLLATGGSPIRLPFGASHIIYFRTLPDYERLRALADHSQRFLVIGAGFIGSEITAALAMQGRHVTLVFPGKSIGEKIYPADLSSYLNDYYEKKGVELVPADQVDGLEERASQLSVHTRSGRRFDVDGAVAGIGIQPNLDLARSAGLNVDNGIVVDDHQRTSTADIYAAGDVARFPHAALGKLVRLEHEDNSLKMGRQAGRNMAGAQEPYNHTPYFYSDLFDLRYEAVGELDSKLETFADWQVPLQKGVIYYLQAGRVRGILLWNVLERRDKAAELLALPGPFTAQQLKGRITA